MVSFFCASFWRTLVEWRVEADLVRLLDAGFRVQMHPFYRASGTRAGHCNNTWQKESAGTGKAALTVSEPPEGH
jgi:hypothetical protein